MILISGIGFLWSNPTPVLLKLITEFKEAFWRGGV